MLYRVMAALVGALAAAALTAPPAAGAPPANDAFGSGLLPFVTGPDGTVRTVVEGTTVEATGEVGEPVHTAGSSPTESVWYGYTAPADGTVVVDTCPFSEFRTTLAVYTGATVDALTPVTSNEDSPECAFGGSRVRFAAVNGTTYRIAVDGVGDQKGAFELSLAQGAQSNDALATAFVIPSPFSTGSLAWDNLNATGEAGEPDHSDTGAEQSSVWFRYTAPADALVTADACESDFDTVLAAYTGSVGALEPLTSNDDSADCASGLGSKVTARVAGGTTVFLALDGFAGDEGHATLRFTGQPAPPVTQDQPPAQAQTQASTQPAAGPTPGQAPRDTAAPAATLTFPPQRLRAALRRGITARVALSEAGRACVALTLTPAAARRIGIRPRRSERSRVVLGSACRAFTAPGTQAMIVRLSARAKKALGRQVRRRRGATLSGRATATDAAGNSTTRTRRLVLRR